VWRWTRRGLLVIAALMAAAFLTFFTVDLGPSARAEAERRASDFLERPMHIGRLKALVWPGRYELDDVVIEGVGKGDQPFLTARKIKVNLGWRTLTRGELFVDVEMTDWKITIETWPGRPSSLPKLTPKSSSEGPRRFTTTVRVTAARGEFDYFDHGTPWSVVAPNLSFNLVRAENLKAYVGTAHFDRGVVQIQSFLPMSASMTTRFTLDGPLVRLHQIDLVTDGARSKVVGEVHLGEGWPEATYNVDSRINFARMRELFFASESWRVNGDGRFVGVFHLPKAGGRELRGQFSSDKALLDTPGRRMDFPRLRGGLLWLPDRFEVTNAAADFYGGQATFDYRLSPLGTPKPTKATFDVRYEGVDLETFARGLQWDAIQLRGRASGSNALSWASGRFSDTMAAQGRTVVTPPAGVSIALQTLPASFAGMTSDPGPFQRDRPIGELPVGGEINYAFDPAGIDFNRSWVASPSTFVGFEGRADYGGKSRLPFHVTSLDWQASDRILAAILTAAGAPTGAIPVGGFGQFDGVMTESFARPRIEGHFAGQAIRSWDVTWGQTIGDIVIQNQFVTITNSTIGGGDRSIVADGRFSLGFQRPESADEELKDIHVRVSGWPLDDFRTAFGLTDWPVAGTIGAADIRLNGPYRGPVGAGTLRVDRGTAWGETFETVSSQLTFNGSGLQVSQIVMQKNAGTVTGSAVLKWDGTYAFDAMGDRIPVESLTSFTLSQAPLSGVLHFTASGEGSFESPRYEFKATIPDLSAGDQGIGTVTGTLQVDNKVLSIRQLEVTSSVLGHLSGGGGTIALNDRYDANLNIRFTNSRIDPYLPLIAPKVAEQLSQYIRATVSGSLQVKGALKDATTLTGAVAVQAAELQLFDYPLNNDGEIAIKYENGIATISRLNLVGDKTSLAIQGDIPRGTAPIHLTATGSANLAILQALSSNLASSGLATVNATLGGSTQALEITGQADIADGRLRYRSFPHGLEQINGPIKFDTNHIDVDGVQARMADGDVAFSGQIRLKGLVPDQFDVRAEGRSLGLRFPPGFRSTVNASLTLSGPVTAPTLGGDVTVLRSIYLRAIENPQALLGVTALGGSGNDQVFTEPGNTTPIKLDVNVRAGASTLRIDAGANAQIYGSADLQVRGTIDAPAITGLINIERGFINPNGSRWQLQPSSIRLLNPSRLQPFFDVTFITRSRVSGEAYDVTIQITGESDRLDLELRSDPPLPQYDLMLVLMGERPETTGAEIREAQSPQLSQQQAMRTMAAQLLALPLSAKIGSVVQRTIPFDTFSIVPLLGNEAAVSATTAGARVTLGKRVSERVFLTYSRALNASRQYDIVLIEYEQSERVSWVLSRNEDRTYALDFRIRHVF
jgi:translocation and assembly module TamB